MISIVVPVYNAELYLKRCLDSILAQTFKQWEAVCVDDGSSDASQSIMEEYARKDNRFRVFTQKNGGASVARNFGIKIAQGDYLFFLDSDDELVPNCLELMWDEVENHPGVEMVMGAWKARYPAVDKNRDYGKSCYLENNEEIRYRFFKDFDCLPEVPWNKLIRKDFIIANNLMFIEGVFHEDEHWSFYLYKRLSTLSIIEDITYHYYITPSSVMRNTNDEKSAKCLFVILGEIIKDFDFPLRSLQVFKYLEFFRNLVHPFLPKSQTRRMYFGFFYELLRIRQFRIAWLWFVNWFHYIKHSQLYYQIIPEAYHKEVLKFERIISRNE